MDKASVYGTGDSRFESWQGHFVNGKMREFRAASVFLTEAKRSWTRWDLNPGPSACEADVIPLHHEPFPILLPHSRNLLAKQTFEEKALSHTGLEPVTFGT